MSKALDDLRADTRRAAPAELPNILEVWRWGVLDEPQVWLKRGYTAQEVRVASRVIDRLISSITP